MDARKREIRTVDCQLAIREAEEGQESQSRTITGTAIVFNAESEVLDDWGERFREVILPEAATQEFLLSTIQPRIRKHEDELNSKLLDPEDFGRKRIHVCELALRRLDAKGQAEIDKLHLESGWSVNELRSQYDLPNIPNGDAHYVSTNLAEVGSDKLRSNGGGAPAESKPTDELEPSNDNN